MTCTYNIDALKRLRDDILAEAEHYGHDQESWGTQVGCPNWSTHLPLAALCDDRGYLPSGLAPMTRGVMLVSCPTAACAAGWAAVGAGAQLIFNPIDIVLTGVSYTEYCLTEDSKIKTVEDHATEVLGLDNLEADYLFSCYWSTEEVVAMIDEIITAAQAGEAWDVISRLAELTDR